MNMKPYNSSIVFRTIFSRSRQLNGNDLSYKSLKIVIRRLPPDMDQNTFLKHISPIPDYDYCYFVKADMQYGKFAFSRAYINFIFEKDLFLFKEKYDGYIFLSTKGVEYPAVVEYATSTRLPKIPFKYSMDPNSNTIHSSFNFNKFLNSYSHGKKSCTEKNVNFDNKFVKSDNDCKNKTPLLMYITQKKQDRNKTIDEGWKNKKNCRDAGGCVFVNSAVRNNKRMY